MDNNIIAICNIEKSCVGNIYGRIKFTETANDLVKINIKLCGLTPGYHGFHIHEAGDIRDNCNGACKHFNPLGQFHGGPNSLIRHVGDLGNIYANRKGIVRYTMYDHMVKLRGDFSIIGRSVVIHENPDDLGLGGIGDKEIRVES